MNQTVSFVNWFLYSILKALLQILQPVALMVLLIGTILWATGLERRTGKRLVIGALIIWFISLIF
ncbi:hypothetical protein B9Q13_06195 [Candidatus Marsarchaeota G2 archaeon ECH_B_SAG-G16]|uniref:Uncharacterized protein n=2 Tax=Candidatus Marsarchaeota group 2 TaxID=2203771 RepID=A0A2R6BZ32_9ARCH|nr:MAG: hypothetical protein B9Q10_00625 [Candidatus Marsarchaeota G2 archaeon ECH_B_SAG-E12]PSO03875.1 MAG: hypothetical protein B9Q13_06195 [Candidatus Marsarchaeota G2 archaeon ECH_B_SAG-G16]